MGITRSAWNVTRTSFTTDGSSPSQSDQRQDGPPAQVRYGHLAADTINKILATQLGAIDEAVNRCTEVIAADGLVHLFGSGHSRIAVEEMFPRYGSYAGFHPIVELSLSNYHQVVGANGLSQAMFIENVEALGPVILDNFRFDPARDVMMVVSSGGTNAVPIEVALEAKRLGLFVIAITSLAHSEQAVSRHSSGKRLFEVADLVIDTCAPLGDAGISIQGLETPVGPLSTIGSVTIINMIKSGVAQRLTELGQPPVVMTSAALVGASRSRELFQRCFEIYSERRRRL
jgi:uncharacterized phosphosugar-binding protein